jgi:GNAT superfamily N-acetyltransferase
MEIRQAAATRGAGAGTLTAMTQGFTVRPLDDSTWSAFAELVERNNGIFGGCWCMGFHDDGSRSSAELNRRRKLERVRSGRPAEVPRIKNRTAYERGLVTPPDWRIACCFVGKGHRRHGVSAAALAGALDLIAGHGGGTVEGYPEDAASVPAGFNGALTTYEQLGFVRDRMIGKHRWVVVREVAPAA